MEINEFKSEAIIVTVPGMDGVDRMLGYLERLIQQNSHFSRVKYKFIDAAMDLMEGLALEDLPQTPNHRDTKYANFMIEVDEHEYNVRLGFVKALRMPNIYEMRINLRQFNWRFRATFFSKIYDGTVYYCIVDPFEKMIGQKDPTDNCRDHTYDVSQTLTDEEFNKHIT